MNKSISLVLVLSFIFALTAQSPVLAVDETASTTASSTAIVVPIITTVIPPTTSTTTLPVINPIIAPATTTPNSGATPILISTPTSSTELTTNPAPVQVTPQVSSTTPTDKNIVKIPSPEYIKYFEKIKKVGNSLYGVKKQVVAAVKQEVKDIKQAINTAKEDSKTNTANLEKITSLEQVKLFDKVTKVGNDLFGIRKTTSTPLTYHD